MAGRRSPSWLGRGVRAARAANVLARREPLEQNRLVAARVAAGEELVRLDPADAGDEPDAGRGGEPARELLVGRALEDDERPVARRGGVVRHAEVERSAVPRGVGRAAEDDDLAGFDVRRQVPRELAVVGL